MTEGGVATTDVVLIGRGRGQTQSKIVEFESSRLLARPPFFVFLWPRKYSRLEFRTRPALNISHGASTGKIKARTRLVLEKLAYFSKLLDSVPRNSCSVEPRGS